MLTIFTTAKKFTGHIGVIQRNALKSWTLLHPDVEVILFGDDEGAAEVARELGIRHEAHVEKSEFGGNRVDFMFAKAQAIARHDVLCYSNCDIILLDDFRDAVEQIRAAHRVFLIVGRRWNADVTEPSDLAGSGWKTEIRERARSANHQADAWWIDYFVFSRELYRKQIPPLIVGRVYWDNWMVWKAKDFKRPVVDVSPVVMAVHQNHDYRHHPEGKQGVWSDKQSQQNFRLAGGFSHLRTIANAHYRLTAGGLKRNRWHEAPYWREAARHYWKRGAEVTLNAWQNAVWHPLLNLTRPLRTTVGLRGGKFSSKPKARD